MSAGRRWGIVGGGMLGLTLAHRFAQLANASRSSRPLPAWADWRVPGASTASSGIATTT